MPTGEARCVARSDRLHVSRPAPLTTLTVPVMLGFAVLPFSLFEPTAGPPRSFRHRRKTDMVVGVVLRDLNDLLAVRLASLVGRRITDHANLAKYVRVQQQQQLYVPARANATGHDKTHTLCPC